MEKNKTSVSKASTYTEIGEYWDTHELPAACPEVEFKIELDSVVHYFALENTMSERVRTAAEKHGVSAETLVNLWVKERLDSELNANI